MNNYLIHYGILGQKWGVQNGPPYPLSKSAMSSSEQKHYNVSAKALKKSMDQMTDAELRKAIDRIELQYKVGDLAKKESVIRRGRKAVTDDLNAFSEFSSKASSAFENGKKIARLMRWL